MLFEYINRVLRHTADTIQYSTDLIQTSELAAKPEPEPSLVDPPFIIHSQSVLLVVVVASSLVAPNYLPLPYHSALQIAGFSPLLRSFIILSH
jgi:hypothetical protein